MRDPELASVLVVLRGQLPIRSNADRTTEKNSPYSWPGERPSERGSASDML